MRTVFFISGPAGVGKTTTSKALVKALEKSSYISGDDVSHIPVNGRGKPWISKETHDLTWENIASITRNLLRYGFDVVIDYVIFPDDVIWFAERLRGEEVSMKYVLLLTDEKTLVARDGSRPEDIRMGKRSIILLHEFLEKRIPKKYIIDTSSHDAEMFRNLINDIKENDRFLFTRFEEV